MAHETSLANKEDVELEGWNRTFNQMWELFFGPEIDRRREAGTLPDDFHLYMGQVLFPETGENRILLNDEIKGEGLVRINRDVQKGDSIYVEDLTELQIFDLPDELLDHGHFTIFRYGDTWRMMFNFMSGRAKARDMLELARQFHSVAVASHGMGFAGPTVDNLFAAAELVCKAELILHRSPAVTSKTHSAVGSAINRWSSLGNIDAAFIALFNRLSRQRPNARYGDAASRPFLPEKDDLDLVEAMIEAGGRTVRKMTDRNGSEKELEQSAGESLQV